MKKLTIQNKKHIKSHSNKVIRNRKKRKNKIYNNNDNVAFNKVSYDPFEKKTIYFKDIFAPKEFNLKSNNCEEFINFVNTLKNLGSNGFHLNINLENCENVGEGAISMFLSVIQEITSTGIIIKGKIPKITKEREKLEKSGFFKYMNANVNNKNIQTKNTILRTGGNKKEKIDLPGEIKKINETIWGVKGRNPLLRGSIFEMMRNSCDHAFKNNKNIVWHLGISHDEDNNQVKFSFVDNGKGIIKSFSEGKLNPFFNIFKDNCDILDQAFKNGIESRTGLSWRGKGLPTIFENYSDGYYKNLIVVTNDVFIDFDNQIYKKLNVPFKGTYYFWLINKSCTKACYT